MGVANERIMDKRYQINHIAAGILIATDQISFAITYTSIITTMIATLINIPILLIFQAIFLPLQLKYEGEKGMIVMIAVVGAVIFISIFLLRMFEMAGVDLVDIMLNHMYLKDTIIGISIYMISIAVWLLSFKISEGIVLKKEF